MTLEELRSTTTCCAFSECHRQSWRDGGGWRGYTDTPRPTCAFILICSDMEMRFTLGDGRIIEAGRGDLVFIPKGMCYTVAFRHPSGQTDSYTVNFLLRDGAGGEVIPDGGVRVARGKTDSALLFAVEAFYKAYLRRLHDWIGAMAAFWRFLDAALALMGSDDCAYYPIRRGVELLTDEWDRNTRISYYAELCRVDKSYFYKLFKARFGVSPNRYRTQLRLAAAKDMLLHTDLGVGEIAARIGFEDPYYFSRFFTKACGMSPRRYRSTHGVYT